MFFEKSNKDTFFPNSNTVHEEAPLDVETKELMLENPGNAQRIETFIHNDGEIDALVYYSFSGTSMSPETLFAQGIQIAKFPVGKVYLDVFTGTIEFKYANVNVVRNVLDTFQDEDKVFDVLVIKHHYYKGKNVQVKQYNVKFNLSGVKI